MQLCSGFAFVFCGFGCCFCCLSRHAFLSLFKLSLTVILLLLLLLFELCVSTRAIGAQPLVMRFAPLYLMSKVYWDDTLRELHLRMMQRMLNKQPLLT